VVVPPHPPGPSRTHRPHLHRQFIMSFGSAICMCRCLGHSEITNCRFMWP
jgi:hypothetical protein